MDSIGAMLNEGSAVMVGGLFIVEQRTHRGVTEPALLQPEHVRHASTESQLERLGIDSGLLLTRFVSLGRFHDLY